MDALNTADVLVLVLPSGRSAHVEAGYHAGHGKPVVVFIPEERSEPELMYKMFTAIHWDWDAMLTELEALSVSFAAKLQDK